MAELCVEALDLHVAHVAVFAVALFSIERRHDAVGVIDVIQRDRRDVASGD